MTLLVGGCAMTPLLGLAAESDQADADAIEILATARADVEARTSCDNTPLMVAALESNWVPSSIATIPWNQPCFLLGGRTSRRGDGLEILHMMLLDAGADRNAVFQGDI